ncbi:hypothetical protein U1Q18_019263 [Sarracenia purpurea var. burkii]
MEEKIWWDCVSGSPGEEEVVGGSKREVDDSSKGQRLTKECPGRRSCKRGGRAVVTDEPGYASDKNGGRQSPVTRITGEELEALKPSVLQTRSNLAQSWRPPVTISGDYFLEDLSAAISEERITEGRRRRKRNCELALGNFRVFHAHNGLVSGIMISAEDLELKSLFLIFYFL